MVPYNKHSMKGPMLQHYMDCVEKKLIHAFNNKFFEETFPYHFYKSAGGANASKKVEMQMPTANNVDVVMSSSKYSVAQLKDIARQYQIKLSGTKEELFVRIYGHLKMSFHASKIQRSFRRYLFSRIDALRGPAMHNRVICNNEYDFLTGDTMQEITAAQFFSYQDKDSKVYGFDLLSIFNLMFSPVQKQHCCCYENTVVDTRIGFNILPNSKNPYNRNPFPETVLQNVALLVLLCKLNGIGITVLVDKPVVQTSKTFEMVVMELFQTIDGLGNYSDSQWFLQLNPRGLLKFVRELSDIWNYRLNLSHETKRLICPPRGDPFRMFDSMGGASVPIEEIRHNILEVMVLLVTSSSDIEYRKLGALYVLMALTLVSENAATTLPALHQSVLFTGPPVHHLPPSIYIPQYLQFPAIVEPPMEPQVP